MKKFLLFYFFLFVFPFTISARKVIFDAPNSDICSLFSKHNVVYVIRYDHQFFESIMVPSHCEIRFEGGSLCGRIDFNETKLSGNVRLQGAKISGTIRNKTFNASWLCYRDGKTDDANNVNQILSVCKDVFFPKGVYWLQSAYQPVDLEGSLKETVRCHIGINKSDIKLRGEPGTNFVTEQVMGMITVYTQPYQIHNSIGKIRIENIKFTTRNDGKNFHEFIHVIKLIGVHDLIIEGCLFEDFWGDGICLSHYGDTPQTGERTRNQNIKVINNTVIGGDHHNNRNGVSVVSGKKIVIKGNTIINTSRNDMPGGIAVEPNNSAYTIDNIKIMNNYIENVKTNAIKVYIYNNGPAHNIQICRNRVFSCGNGITIAIKTDNTADNFIIKGNIIDKLTNPFIFGGEGHTKKWEIANNIMGRASFQKIPGNIKVKDLKVKNNIINF